MTSRNSSLYNKRTQQQAERIKSIFKPLPIEEIQKSETTREGGLISPLTEDWKVLLEDENFFWYCSNNNQEDRDSGELNDLSTEEKDRLVKCWKGGDKDKFNSPYPTKKNQLDLTKAEEYTPTYESFRDRQLAKVASLYKGELSEEEKDKFIKSQFEILEKGGVGSGRKIGSTKSGKPVFESIGGGKGHTDGYDRQDFLDAADLHEKEQGKNYDKKNYVLSKHHEKMSSYHNAKAKEFKKSEDIEKGGQGSGRKPISNFNHQHLNTSSSKLESFRKQYKTENDEEGEHFYHEGRHIASRKNLSNDIYHDGTLKKSEESNKLSESPKFKKVMQEWKDGTLKTSSGEKVTDQKQALAIAFSEAENIEKGGEGSRGGKVIGYTKSGKPIYEHHHPETFNNYSAQDHRDAIDVHKKEASRHSKIAEKTGGFGEGMLANHQKHHHNSEMKRHSEVVGEKINKSELDLAFDLLNTPIEIFQKSEIVEEDEELKRSLNYLDSLLAEGEVQKSEEQLAFELLDSEIVIQDLEKGRKLLYPIGSVLNGYKKIKNGVWKKISESGSTKKEHIERAKDFERAIDDGADLGDGYTAQDAINYHLRQASSVDDKDYSDEQVGIKKTFKNGESVVTRESDGSSHIGVIDKQLTDDTYLVERDGRKNIFTTDQLISSHGAIALGSEAYGSFKGLPQEKLEELKGLAETAVTKLVDGETLTEEEQYAFDHHADIEVELSKISTSKEQIPELSYDERSEFNETLGQGIKVKTGYRDPESGQLLQARVIGVSPSAGTVSLTFDDGESMYDIPFNQVYPV